MENETTKQAKWFDVGPVMQKEVGNLSFEVWANGRFNIGSPNGNGSNPTLPSAEDWLVEHGINNDAELENAMCDNDGWTLTNNRWFDLIAFELDENMTPYIQRNLVR